MPEEVAILAFTGILAGTVVLTQIIRTIGRLVERKGAGTAQAEEVAAVRSELEALRSSVDAMRHQVGEVEERIDFAERLLARERQPDRLPQGGE